MKKPLKEAVGKTFNHKRLGKCLIDSVVNEVEGKIKIIVTETKEEKILIFAPQFFDGIDEYQTVNVSVKPKKVQKKVHRPVNLDKYRNHPLVKEIDAKEKGYKPRDLYEDTTVEKPHINLKEVSPGLEIDNEEL
jgi:hypothetical protein